MADCHVHNALNWIVCFMTSAQSMENLHIRHVSPMYTHTHTHTTHTHTALNRNLVMSTFDTLDFSLVFSVSSTQALPN